MAENHFSWNPPAFGKQTHFASFLSRQKTMEFVTYQSGNLLNEFLLVRLRSETSVTNADSSEHKMQDFLVFRDLKYLPE